MKIFITLISDQSIPNLQYIKEFNGCNRYIFISTEKMEGLLKSSHIIDASQLNKNDCTILKVSEESYTDIRDKISSLNIGFTDELIVNCTLGTKVMSIALFDIFRNYPNAKLLYTPIGTNKYKSILNEQFSDEFKYQISVREYFTCYGIKIEKISEELHDYKRAKSLIGVFQNLNNDEYNLIDDLRFYRDKGYKNINENENLVVFLNKIRYPIANNMLTKYDVQYLTGGWFEEYIYSVIKEKYSLSGDKIALGVMVKQTAQNDLDVVFVLNNNLHVIECKTTLGQDLTQSTLYKSGAIIEKFGKAAKSYLCTLQDLRDDKGSLKNSVELRARQQNITIFDKTDLNNIDNLKL